jgi:hypothetical protein
MTHENGNANGHVHRKSWIRRHKIITGLAIVIVLIFVSVVAGSAGSNSDPSQHAVSSGKPTANAKTMPSNTPPDTPELKVARVRFVISGNVPSSEFGEVDITYGINRDSHDVTFSNGFSGTHVYSMRFDGTAQYYSIDSTFTSQGHLKCRIVAVGPNVTPLTVSHGSASGNGGDCSAQAAPNDNKGSSWSDEQ